MFARCVTGLMFLAACAPGVSAQVWPTQPIKILVGFPPGGIADVISRYVQSIRRDSLGQPLVGGN
ncbi:MAG: tripartite tricarboxylate transporter substrate binding protein, partial [Betaproteobacteria bacterium]